MARLTVLRQSMLVDLLNHVMAGSFSKTLRHQEYPHRLKLNGVAKHHAPHGLEEKQQSFLNAPFGIVGSETAFQLIYTNFVETGIFTLEQVIDWMAVKPAEIFGLNAGIL
jgi:hypothetical protein